MFLIIIELKTQTSELVSFECIKLFNSRKYSITNNINIRKNNYSIDKKKKMRKIFLYNTVLAIK